MPPLPQALSDGDTVALLTPASPVPPEWVATSSDRVESWGFRAQVGRHVGQQVGYLAGTDEQRLDDLNAAIRDPQVRAILCLAGGCGSFRLLHGVDTTALRADPKPLIGYSDITALHRVWHLAGVPALHGAVAGIHADDVDHLLRGGVCRPLATVPGQYGAELTTSGQVSGPLFGGNLEMLARSVGVLELDLSGHVLLLEINKAAGLGNVDRALTQLIMSGALHGIIGVALGWLAGFDDHEDRGWTILDVLRDRFAVLDVPVLAGLPLGHDPDPRTVPLSTDCRLDADHGYLTCQSPTEDATWRADRAVQ